MKKNNLENFSQDRVQDILISTKERPIWQKVLAALLFTLMLACIYFFALKLAGICFVFAIRCSLMKDYYFDLKDKQYKIVKRIGFVEIGKWRDFHDLDYISIFKNKKDILEVNLWYNENEHFNLGTIDDLPIALKVGRKIAQKLQIDLWDAGTDPRHGQWVELTEKTPEREVIPTNSILSTLN